MSSDSKNEDLPKTSRGGSHRERESRVALGQGDKLTSAIVGNSPDCIKILDQAGRIIWVSPKGLELMEAGQPADLEGRSWLELWENESGLTGARLALDAALSGDVGRLEDCALTCTGRRRWWNVALVALPATEGEELQFLAISRDVTGHRVIEDRLRESEERFRNMADHAPVMVWLAGKDGRRSYLSKSWHEFSGSPPSGDPLEDWSRAVHPEDLAEIRTQLLEAHHQHQGRTVEYRARRTDGEYRWLLDTAVQRQGLDGKFAGYIGSMIDMTDRKVAEGAVRQSEELFRTLANSIPQLAWMARPDGRIFWFNQRWYDYTGTVRGTAAAEDWKSFHGQGESPGAMNAFASSLQSGEPFQEAFTLRRHDGEYRWHLCQMLPIRDEEGLLRLWFGTHTDITEERESLRKKDQFLATLAHELRNPIAPILTGLELIRSQTDSAEISRLTSMMERQTKQMVHLIDDLLDMTRINTGKILLKKSAVRLRDVLESAVEAAEPYIGQYGHHFENVPAPCDIIIETDPNRMAQVVSNLLSNAAKYTPPGGHIRLSHGTDGNRPWITIEDDGNGIEPDQQEHIFDLFVQTDQARQDGLGIGLTLVKSLVELHGGEIEVHSDGAGEGSRFTVRLPECLSAELPGQEEIETMGSPAGHWRRVLVVDDGRSTADILGMFFEMEGREVRVAYDGADAVELAKSFAPDLILMDLGMPRMDGFEAARHIRALPSGDGITMVALSGWGQEKDRRLSREAGFDEHLVKPVSPIDLRELLEILKPRRE
ncbi:hybrid sensor histidine kinase/response regulator [Luteolibacter luteus]|uniref:histidine kinase n=1 Tax=Luteolibacter luteus TaxID=2728835 RepID=A0A858RLI8_9BACT|nr:PAS domain S-box protein [Luteolibacter luteus]QJE97364.1 PAS domain S-box protein [Luteolibacter luteus]